jgi:aryl-alcohol dehydrogenase-like predicted oxidoreductase
MKIRKWLSASCKFAASNTIPTNPLGKTGHKVTIISLGGQGMLEIKESKKAVDVVHEALDLGINYIDTAASYGDGVSEKNIGQVIKDGRREEFYLATKTDERDEDKAWRQINESVERLGSEPDCVQIHHLDGIDEVDKVFSSSGALKSLVRARQEGLCRFLGITGHSDPTVLLEALERHPFDTVLGALNIADPYYYSFQTRLIPYCAENDIGFVAMKVCSRGKLFGDDIGMQECLNYVWSIPGVTTAIVGISSISQLRKNVEVAKSYKELSHKEMWELEKIVEPRIDDVLYFRKGKKWDDDVHDHPDKLPTEVR